MLESLGRWEESLAAYFLCLHFSSGSTDVTPIICQVSVAFRNDLVVHTYMVLTAEIHRPVISVSV